MAADGALHDVSAWIGRNGSRVGLGLAVFSFAVCVVATAGVCTAAGAFAAAATISGRSVQYAAGDVNGLEWLAYSSVDALAVLLPGSQRIEAAALERATPVLARAAVKQGVLGAAKARAKTAVIKGTIRVFATLAGAGAQAPPLVKAGICDADNGNVICK